MKVCGLLYALGEQPLVPIG